MTQVVDKKGQDVFNLLSSKLMDMVALVDALERKRAGAMAPVQFGVFLDRLKNTATAWDNFLQADWRNTFQAQANAEATLRAMQANEKGVTQ